MNKLVLYFLLVVILIFSGIVIYNRFIVDHYVKFYDPKIIEIQNKLSTAIPEIKKINLSGSNRSFTINKQDVYICTKDNNGQYYNDNMLTYVLLHELAHVLCDEVGHTAKFKNIFQNLLDRAARANLYNPDIPPIDNYCNT
jgi:Zn-dependent peptidase ImmA (M78 family)